MEIVPYLDLRAQYRPLRSEVLSALEEICESTSFAQGRATSEFEAKFAGYCGVEHCVSLNSGTSALHLALRCLDVGPGDEVVTVSMSFIATAWAISYVGATPVFVDIDPVRRTLNPDNLEAAITPRTKAIIPVHLYGMPAEMDRIMEIAERHGVPVIEDAAQAHGAKYRNKRVGQFAQIACFSFYPGKNLGAYGEGGALITNDASIAQRARSLRDHAQSQKYLHDEIGYNYRMDSFQGAVLAIKLKHLDEWNTARNEVAQFYTELLKDSSYKLPAHLSDSECVWHCYVIETPRARSRPLCLAGRRDSECRSLSCADSPPKTICASWLSNRRPASDGSTVRRLSLSADLSRTLERENFPCRFRSSRSGEWLTRRRDIRLGKTKSRL